MFDGLTAWFSTSVNQKKKVLWYENGGSDAEFEESMFLFSEDECCDDTERIFTSDAYLDEHLSVFHPNFILECAKKGDVRKGVLGKYFLPPKGIQTIGKTQIQYAWDIDGHNSDRLESVEDDAQNKPGPTKHTVHNGHNQPGPSKQTGHDALNQPGPNKQTGHDARNQPGPNKQTGHDARNQPGPNKQTGHDAQNQPGPNKQTGHDARNQPGPNKQTGHDAGNQPGPNKQTGHDARNQPGPSKHHGHDAQNQPGPNKQTGHDVRNQPGPNKQTGHNARKQPGPSKQTGHKSDTRPQPDEPAKGQQHSDRQQNHSGHHTKSTNSGKKTATVDREEETNETDTGKSPLDKRKRKSSESNTTCAADKACPAKRNNSGSHSKDVTASSSNKHSTHKEISVDTGSGNKTSVPGHGHYSDKEINNNSNRKDGHSHVDRQNVDHTNVERMVGNVPHKKSLKAAMEAETLRLEDLAKVTGELNDFVVGQHGSELVDEDQR